MQSMHRSTSRASKQRRELIKTEIDRLREMLPLPNAVKARLSFLHVMSLACVYVRKGHYFNQDQDVIPPVSRWDDTSPFDFTQALHGFLLVMTRQGKLLYISENVTDYLGHSMVELLSTGGDLYEVIDPRDHAVVRGQMNVNSNTSTTENEYQSDDERTFFCRMNTSRNMRRKDHCTDNKMVRIKGRFRILWSGCCYSWNQVEPVFTAVCSPVETLTPISDEMAPLKTSMFSTEHGMDMVVYDASSNVFFHLGYEANEVCGMSWYTLVHPDYLETARKYHQQMLQPSIGTAASRCAFVLRLLHKDCKWVTVSVTAWLDRDTTVNHAAVIMCQNLVIREDEIAMYESQALHESLARRSASCIVSSSPASASGSSERFSCGMGDDGNSSWQETQPRGDVPAPPCPIDSTPIYGYETGQTQRSLQSFIGESIPHHYLDDHGTHQDNEWRYDSNYNYQGTQFNNSTCHLKVVNTGWQTQIRSNAHETVERQFYQGSYGPYSSVLVGPARPRQSLRSTYPGKECLVDGCDVNMIPPSHGHGLDATAVGSDPCPALKRAVLEWAKRLKAKRQIMTTYRNKDSCLTVLDYKENERKRLHQETSSSVSLDMYKAETDYPSACTPSKRRMINVDRLSHSYQSQLINDTDPTVTSVPSNPEELPSENGIFATSWVKLPPRQRTWWTDSGRGNVNPVNVPDSILTPESSPTHDDSSPGKPKLLPIALSDCSPETAAVPVDGTQHQEERPASDEESDPIVGTLEAAVGKALCALSSDELRLLDQATISLMYQNGTTSRPVSFPTKTLSNSDNK